MIYGHKNTNRPMIVVVTLNHIRQGGWYGYHYNDMDVADPAISSIFHSTCQSHIYATDMWLVAIQFVDDNYEFVSETIDQDGE